LVDASVSEKHAASIFRAEVAMLGSGGIYVRLEEVKAEGEGQSEMRNEREKILGQWGATKQHQRGGAG
jgi:hypothetical protein